MIKQIFDKNVYLEFDQFEYSDLLKNELKLYKESDKSIDLKIFINKEIDYPIITNNPKIHFEYEKAIGMKFDNVDIIWSFRKNIPEIYLSIASESNGKIKNSYKKFRNIQYALPGESIGQIIHELVFVPFTYIFDELVPIHCSSFVYNNKAYLLGGAGGVGKTSAILEIGKEHDITFLCDDILIVNDQAEAFPNYAYPKIYAYNTEQDKDTERSLLKGDSFLSKLQWQLKKKKNPLSVRRRISPSKFYQIGEKRSYCIDTYILFNRGSFNKASYTNINYLDIADMTLNIMKSEYWTVNNQYYWHLFNSKLLNKKPIIDLEDVFNRWKNVYIKTFKNINTFVFNIPMNIEHTAFKNDIKNILLNEIMAK